MKLRCGKVGFRPDGRWKVAGGQPALRRTLRNPSPGRFAPGWALDQNLNGFTELRISDRHNFPAPIRARTESDRRSGGVPKAANHRLLSVAHPGGNCQAQATFLQRSSALL
ncbi:MAG: hypothetical protein HY774_09480 [Acidobacteria bacterium]|nr:hypothetical protein [Acidobacteriota bacterium]